MKRHQTMLVILFLLGASCYRSWTCTADQPSLDNLRRWHDYLKVTTAPSDAAIATTQTNLSNVSISTAYAKMCQSLESYNAKLGYRLSTGLHVARVDMAEEGDSPDLLKIDGEDPPAITPVVVRGHMYYIALLDFPADEENLAAYREVGGVIPAIAVVDAEDETKSGWVRTHDDKGNPYKIRLYPGSQAAIVDDNNIYRHLRNRGYSTAVSCHRLDNPTLEVDDDWRPYFTASFDKDDNCYSATIGSAWYPDKLLVVDAQTKKTDAYSLDDPNTSKDERDPHIPAWVDQIYSPKIVREWVANWSYNLDNYGKTSKLNDFVIDGNIVDQVMNASNTNIVFMLYLTSTLPDNSVIGVMLVDPRTGLGTYYPTQGRGRAMAAKTIAMDVIREATLRWGYGVEDLTLHTIYGVPTWEGEVTLPSEGEHGHRGSLYAGTVLLKADDNMMPADVVWASIKREAFTRYEKRLYLRQTERVGSNVLVEREAKGTVAAIHTVVIGGDTNYLVRLVEMPDDVFEVPLVYLGDPESEDVLQAKPGDTMYLRYADLQNSKIFTVREIHLLKP